MPYRNEREDERHSSPEYKQAVAQVGKKMEKQSDVYDKLWCGVLYEGYAAAAGALDRDRKNQEKQKIKERYAAAGTQDEDQGSLEDELEAVDDQYDPESLMANDLLDSVEKSIKDELFQFSTVEEQRAVYQKMGVINARASYEAGKDYQKWLDSDLLKDDPDKEAKSEYLARNMRSRAQYIALGNQALQYALNASLDQAGSMNFEDSFLADRDSFRKMTMRDFCRQAFMNEEQAGEYVRELKDRGIQAELDSNAYSVFEAVSRKANGNQDASAISEEEVLTNAFKAYSQKSAMYYQNIGIDVVRNNLPAAEQKIFGVGVLLNNDRDYKPPKSIREWIQNVADPLIQASESEGIRTACEELKADADADVVYEVTKTEPLSHAFGRTDAPVAGYQEYIRSNLGVDVLNLSFEEQRMHVARAMAADTLRESRVPFHEETILTRADEFLKSDRFSKLSNREISELVAGGSENIRKFRRELVRETFAADERIQEIEEPDKAAESIETLQENLAGRERTVAALIDRKQRTELYTESLDKTVAQAKNYLETLRKLSDQRKDNSDEFQNMERALENVSKINKNMSPQQVQDLMTQLGAAAGAYRKRIDGSWHRGILANGQARRNLSESLGYFVVSQKGSLQTLGNGVMASESGINRQLMALDKKIEDAKQAVEDAKADLENAETEAAIRAVNEAEAKEVEAKEAEAKEAEAKEVEAKEAEAKEAEAKEAEAKKAEAKKVTSKAVGEADVKEAVKQPRDKVQQAVNREEAYRKSLDPKAVDYQEKLLQSAERSLFIHASVEACEKNAGKLGAKKSWQILDSTMDKMLKASEGNSISFRAFKAEYLDKKLFNEHFAKQVIQSAKQGKVSEADIVRCRDEALKASFADRRADEKPLNQLKAVLGARIEPKKPERKKTGIVKPAGSNKTSDNNKTRIEKQQAPGRR